MSRVLIFNSIDHDYSNAEKGHLEEVNLHNNLSAKYVYKPPHLNISILANID